MSQLRVVTIVGARPQFIKAAVVSRAIRRWNDHHSNQRIDEHIIHTGQHFDENMSDVFFEEMEIPRPHRNLGISGGRHGAMTGRMLEEIEQVLLQERPDRVLVYGDTNSTLAGALAAAKLHIPAAHVEAGLRSFNRRMPEEINRIVADHTSDLLFPPTVVARDQLLAEGVPAERIDLVGDVMYDAMQFYRDKAQSRSRIGESLGLGQASYILATVHRAENTDDPDRLIGVIDGLCALAASTPVVLPLHPRTKLALERDGLYERAASMLRLIDPVGYFDMIMLEANAALIATDSGGVQKEAFFNRVPCITLRDETEWTELVEIGANRLVGANAGSIIGGADDMLGVTIDEHPLYGDGRAGEAIVRTLTLRAANPACAAAVSPRSRIADEPAPAPGMAPAG